MKHRISGLGGICPITDKRFFQCWHDSERPENLNSCLHCNLDGYLGFDLEDDNEEAGMEDIFDILQEA